MEIPGKKVKAPEGRHRFVIAGLVAFMWLGMGAPYLGMTPLFPIIREEYHISRLTVSLLFAAPILCQGLFSIPGGLLITRLGVKRTYALGWLALGAGLAMPLAPNFGAVLALRLVFGLGVAITFPVTGSVLAQWLRPREMTIFNGVNNTTIGLSSALGLFVAVPLASVFDWQVTMAIFSVPALVGALLWIAIGREGRPIGRTGGTPGLRSSLRVLRQRNTLLLCLAALGPFSIFSGFASWLPTFYHEVRELSLTTAGSLTGLFQLSATVGAFLSGLVAFYLGLRRPVLLASGFLSASTAFALFLAPTTPLIYLSVVAAGAVVMMYLPTLLTIPSELPDMNPVLVATIWAAIFSAGNMSSFLFPLLIGLLADITGSYTPGFTVAALSALTLVVGGLLLPETGPRRRDAPSPTGE